MLLKTKANETADVMHPKPARRVRTHIGRIVYPSAFLLFTLAMWEVVPTLLAVPTIYFPSLTKVLAALLDPAALPLYLSNGWVTLSEALLGLSIGATSGFVIGIILAEVDILRRTFYPYIVAFESIPKVAIAPLLLIWFGFGIESKIVVVALLTFFPLMINTMSGFKNVDRNQIEMMRVYGATGPQIRWKLVLPSALPQILTGFEVAVVLSTLGAIVAEFVGGQNGLGVLIIQAQFQMNTPAVFALLLILGAIGVTLNLLVRTLRRRLIHWIDAEQDAYTVP
ncbi:ABC transporter permease [Pseudarthrobacter sp. fls2-241-R2A-168]|uniref:ABC transporter permease n=1 Tax=Pseudarthrobacter sp. fls2-241-R2A-168 TaxID=3040304 RepID=UPI0025564F64|nr:ABC transporter permease [Pseudarthrobacter sp. fls2-241-R2A-168]